MQSRKQPVLRTSGRGSNTKPSQLGIFSSVSVFALTTASSGSPLRWSAVRRS
jgi:hypothetical protein